jgi:hypothetical protein
VRPGDEIRASGFDHREHAFAKGAHLGRPVLRVGVELLVVFEVGLGKHVAGVRKGRHPAAVPELCVPADVVVMQVGAHDEIDLVRPCTGGREAFEVGRVHHVPEWPPGLVLVIAAARVDQDLLLADLQEPAVHAELDQAGFRLVVIGREPRPVLVQNLLAQVGKDLGRRIGRAIDFLDPGDGGSAYVEYRHARPPSM